ncbi:MAG: TIGR01212 family radical SAM protein [Tannerella sp.]|jgi:radical SAM protein (TIGR01212 family)|nr:TIGR01212 family radical SAM protein [Tannerella sp.]
MAKPYYEFSDFLNKRFPFKVQKISVNAGFTCPNRDGSKGIGGCTYCNNATFNPGYCRTAGMGVSAQLEAGIRFFARKYPQMKYLAYFQAYTNTYASLEALRQKYEEALSFPDVVGLILGTRPDCMPDVLLDFLSELSQKTFLFVEYGLESASDRTLQRIRRGHTWQDSVDAVRRTHERGLLAGAHLILGLPGEDREQLLRQAGLISALPLTALKLHQLQIIRHTVMEKEFREHPEHFRLYSVEAYTDLVIDFLERLRPDMAVDRFISQSPRELLVAPDWGIKNHEFKAILNQRFAIRQTRQGKRFQEPERMENEQAFQG